MPFHDLYDDTEEAGRLVVACQKAIVEHFTEGGDWREFAYETGTHEYLLRHKRLLRSLSWGDADYGACVYEVLGRFSQEKVSAFQALVEHPKIRPELERTVGSILARIGLLQGHVPPISPATFSAPEIVSVALKDADALLETSGPISCVDRLHTALHGYFRHLCEAACIPAAEGAPLTAVFKALRTSHPALQDLGSQDQDVSRVLQGFASVIDALNSIRNNASVAHPNAGLLGESEAVLMVNAVRTVFHYVRRRVEE